MKVALKPLSYCSTIFYPQEPHSVPEISFLLHIYISQDCMETLQAQLWVLSVCLTSIALACLGKKKKIINLNYVRSKSSQEEVMRIKINFIILSRAAFPREKVVFFTLLSWYLSWPRLGKPLPHNHLLGGAGVQGWGSLRRGDISLQAFVRYAKALLVSHSHCECSNFGWFPDLTDSVSRYIVWEVWTCHSQLWLPLWKPGSFMPKSVLLPRVLNPWI